MYPLQCGLAQRVRRNDGQGKKGITRVHRRLVLNPLTRLFEMIWMERTSHHQDAFHPVIRMQDVEQEATAGENLHIPPRKRKNVN